MFEWLLDREVPTGVALSLGVIALGLLVTMIFIVARENSSRKKISNAPHSPNWTDSEAIMLEDIF